MRQGSSFPPPHRPTQQPPWPSGLLRRSSPPPATPPTSKRGAGMILVSKRSRISAQLGGGGGGDGETKTDGKKFITREEEPEQYWQTAGERKGENPMMTPLPYIVIFGFSTPFIILAIAFAFANGWIKAPILR